MTDIQLIRQGVIAAMLEFSELGLLSPPNNSHELLTLADEIATFIDAGTIPSAP